MLIALTATVYADELSARALAAEFAPILYQDVADGPVNDADLRRLDLLAAVDFDGNFDAFDDQEHADEGADPLRGAVYYDVVETSTHAFIVYSLFHPVDWSGFGSVDHENDMEQLWMVIEKHADGTNSLRVLHAQAHGELLAWSDDPPKGAFPIEDGGIRYEDGRPAVFLEAHGHGPASCTHAGGLPYTETITCDPGAADDMVIYRPDVDADLAAIPEPDVSEARPVDATYALISAHEVLWPRRAAIDGDQVPALWDQPFDYTGGRASDVDPFNDLALDPTQLRMGGDFAGDQGDGGGQPPWGYAVHDSFLGGTYYGADGDWLLDPAWLYHAMYRDDRCSDLADFWNYLDNPYLEDTRQTSVPAPWDGVDRGHRCDGDLPVADTGELPIDTGAADSDAEPVDTDVPDSDANGAAQCRCSGGSAGGGLVIGFGFAIGWARRKAPSDQRLNCRSAFQAAISHIGSRSSSPADPR